METKRKRGRPVGSGKGGRSYDEILAANRIYHARKRKELISQGLCINCRQPALEGVTRCAACCDRQLEKDRERRERLIAAGICVVCGKAPAKTGIQKCYACAVKNSERSYRWYLRKHEEKRT